MKWVRNFVARAIELASNLTPKRPHVVLHGFPADEGNIVEVARGLEERYPGKIIWLVDERAGWKVSPEHRKTIVVPKYSFKAFCYYVSAETVFFTHGLYGDPRPRRGQTVVNLWHGDGFKIKKDAEQSKRSIYPANYTVGCTELLTGKRAADFKMPMSAMLVVGNPRMDQFYHPVTSESQSALGLRENDKYVVWLPTFRANHGAGVTKGWSDVEEGAPDPNVSMVRIIASLRSAGVAVVVKPHPQDRDMRQIPGAIVVDNSDLDAAGTTLYALLGGSAGLITDYSSVWTEYLALDRPIGFVMPDKEQYLSRRGLHPSDVFNWLPGPELRDTDAIDLFVREVTNPEEQFSKLQRQKASIKLGLNHGAGRTTDNLLDRLDANGVFSRSGGIKKRVAASGHARVMIQREL